MDLVEVRDEGGRVTGFRVEIILRDLENRRSYVVAVAAESAVGIGPFSDPLDDVSLGELC